MRLIINDRNHKLCPNSSKYYDRKQNGGKSLPSLPLNFPKLIIKLSTLEKETLITRCDQLLFVVRVYKRIYLTMARNMRQSHYYLFIPRRFLNRL